MTKSTPCLKQRVILELTFTEPKTEQQALVILGKLMLEANKPRHNIRFSNTLSYSKVTNGIRQRRKASV